MVARMAWGERSESQRREREAACKSRCLPGGRLRHTIFRGEWSAASGKESQGFDRQRNDVTVEKQFADVDAVALARENFLDHGDFPARQARLRQYAEHLAQVRPRHHEQRARPVGMAAGEVRQFHDAILDAAIRDPIPSASSPDISTLL